MQHELDNLQLERILRSDKCTRNKFIGVFSKDTLPKKPKYPSCFIFNTDPHNLPGQHWIAVHLDEDGVCTFFDPLGFSPKFYELDTYFGHISTKLTYNKSKVQPFYSRKCGYYCFLFLLFKCRSIRVRLSEKILTKYFHFQ